MKLLMRHAVGFGSRALRRCSGPAPAGGRRAMKLLMRHAVDFGSRALRRTFGGAPNPCPPEAAAT